MLAMLKGSVAAVETGIAVIDVSGVGYEVHMPQTDLASLRGGMPVTVHTSLNISQDAVTLYGFLSRGSKTLFTQLQKVSGIGPRVALSILSTLTADQLAKAVSDGDAATLSRAPGLGKKGAQKIILELSGRLEFEELGSRTPSTPLDPAMGRVVEGLVSLGWQQHDAQRAVEGVCREEGYTTPLAEKEIPSVLKKALTSLDRGR